MKLINFPNSKIKNIFWILAIITIAENIFFGEKYFLLKIIEVLYWIVFFVKTKQIDTEKKLFGIFFVLSTFFYIIKQQNISISFLNSAIIFLIFSIVLEIKYKRTDNKPMKE